MAKPTNGSKLTSVVMPHGQWPNLMSKQLARAYIDVSQRTFERLIAARVIQGVSVPGTRLLRYRRSELDEFSNGLLHGRGESPGV